MAIIRTPLPSSVPLTSGNAPRIEGGQIPTATPAEPTTVRTMRITRSDIRKSLVEPSVASHALERAETGGEATNADGAAETGPEASAPADAPTPLEEFMSDEELGLRNKSADADAVTPAPTPKEKAHSIRDEFIAERSATPGFEARPEKADPRDAPTGTAAGESMEEFLARHGIPVNDRMATSDGATKPKGPAEISSDEIWKLGHKRLQALAEQEQANKYGLLGPQRDPDTSPA